MLARLELEPVAQEQAEEIQLWWVTHRPKAPGRFVEELEHAYLRLIETPHVGLRCRWRQQEVRLLLLPEIRRPDRSPGDSP